MIHSWPEPHRLPASFFLLLRDLPYDLGQHRRAFGFHREIFTILTPEVRLRISAAAPASLTPARRLKFESLRAHQIFPSSKRSQSPLHQHEVKSEQNQE